jgi:hypothetical protein
MLIEINLIVLFALQIPPTKQEAINFFCNTGKPVDTGPNRRYGAFMQTLDLKFLDRNPNSSSIQIESAEDCDGSLCHQPIFREDGTLNHVPPHSHLMERDPSGELRCYAVFCDFPAEEKAARNQAKSSACY